MPPEVSEPAVAALSSGGESATGRVFAARRELGAGESLGDALVAHARRQSRLSFAPPPPCERDVRRLCRAAREQGHPVDPDDVLAAAVPADRATVLERARAVRDASRLSPSERERRLTALLEDARGAGFAVERGDVLGEVTAGEKTPERRRTSGSGSEGSVPDQPAECVGSDGGERTNEAPSVEEAAAALTAIRVWEWGPRDDASPPAASEPSPPGGQAVALDGGEQRTETGVSDVDVPDPRTLSSWLVGAGRNRIPGRR